MYTITLSFIKNIFKMSIQTVSLKMYKFAQTYYFANGGRQVSYLAPSHAYVY